MTDRPAPTPVRVRGIYATGLSEWLRRAEDLAVVDPSPTIAARFEGELGEGPPTVTLDMTEDRLGAVIEGPEAAVEQVTERVEAIAADTFTWPASLPRGLVARATVEGSTRGGTVLDVDGTEGYLPDRAVEADLAGGDELRVQVAEPTPPWNDRRPRLDTTVRVRTPMVSLVRGVSATVTDTPSGKAGQELARTTALLSATVPDGWGVEWHGPAVDAGMDALDQALSHVVERATAIERDLTEAPGDGVLAAPAATTWVRFGRASRFALDDARAAVTDTMPGHHRIKAGSEGAGDAVDFLEALDQSIDAFPFAAATTAFGPVEGDTVRIVHGKPGGAEFALGRGTVTNRDPDTQRVTVRRELSSAGTYDALGTERQPGDTATTRLQEGRWWYPTVYRGEDRTPKGTYVNVATPLEVFPGAVRYVDLHVDVVKRPDGSVEIVDEDELAAAEAAGHVQPAAAERARETAATVADLLRD
jgi:Ribonuclease G/E